MNFEGIATIWLLVWTWLKMSPRHSLKLIRMSYKTGPKGKKYYFLTAKWIWDRCIYSIIKPSIDMTLFQSEDLHRFAWNLQHLLAKLFLLLFLNNFTTKTITKTILWANAANFLQICVNLQKYWSNVMSIDGLILEYMDLSHIHLAVRK